MFSVGCSGLSPLASKQHVHMPSVAWLRYTCCGLGLRGCVRGVGRAAHHASGCARVACCALTGRPRGCTGHARVSCDRAVV
eukprot:1136506-Alexandrium_andersonii.AAC.1